MTQPGDIKWPDPPHCCSHVVNVHSREACQEPRCDCTPSSYRRRVMSRAKPIPAPSQPPADLGDGMHMISWQRGYAQALLDVEARLAQAIDELSGWEP